MRTNDESGSRVGVFALLLAASLASGCLGSDPVHTSDPARITEVTNPPPLATAHAVVKRGEPLDLTLRRLSLAADERVSALKALGSEVDFRRIFPGETVEVGRDQAGVLRLLTLQRDSRRSVVVRFPPEGEPRADSVELKPEIRLRNLEGSVSGNLYEAVLAAGGDAKLVMRFADLLAWQVDFLTEPRSGDSFRILVEEERLAEDNGFGNILALEYRGRRASARAIRYVDTNGVTD